MSNEYTDMEETSSPLHENRGHFTGTENPCARAEQDQPPQSPLFLGTKNVQPDLQDLPDYDDLESGPRSTQSSMEESHQNTVRQADDFLENLSVPAPRADASLDDEDFRAACTGATRGLQVNIDAASRDDLIRNYHQRHGGKSNVRDMDLVLKHFLPSMLDAATAVVGRVRSECDSVVQDQVFLEYQLYASKNREDFIQKLAEEAWPRARKRVKSQCRLQYQKEMAELDEHKGALLKGIDAEAEESLARKKAEVDKEINTYKVDEFSKVKNWLLDKSATECAAVDVKTKQYQKEEEAKRDESILREKELRTAILRSTLDREIEEERKKRIKAMEAELALQKTKEWTKMKSEMAAIKSKLFAQVTHQAVPGTRAARAPVEDESKHDAVTGPKTAAKDSVQDGGNTPTDDNGDIEGDTTLINDTATSPPAAPAKPSRGRKRSRSASNDGYDGDCEKPTGAGLKPNEPVKPTPKDERPPKRSCMDKMFNLPPPALTANPASNDASEQVLGTEKLPNDDGDKNKGKNGSSSYFRASSNWNLKAPDAVGQKAVPKTTPSVPQNTGTEVPAGKPKYTFGHVNRLNEDEEEL